MSKLKVGDCVRVTVENANAMYVFNKGDTGTITRVFTPIDSFLPYDTDVELDHGKSYLFQRDEVEIVDRSYVITRSELEDLVNSNLYTRAEIVKRILRGDDPL